MKIFLDMDGVLANFAKAAMAVHGGAYDIATHPRGKKEGYDLEGILGISTNQFWKLINESGVLFWQSLELEPEAIDLVRTVDTMIDREKVYILSHGFGGDAIKGKIDWIDKHFPWLRGRVICTGHKHLFAGPDRILIDDKEENIDLFQKHGGHGILYPQPWNRCHSWIDRKIEFATASLEKIFRSHGRVNHGVG